MSELQDKYDVEQCLFNCLSHHRRKRTSCVLMGQREERDRLCSVPRVTDILDFGVTQSDETVLQSPQRRSKDGE